MKLLSRDQFREGVFSRDEHKCVICGDPAKDAHHIIERRLFSDGGYYLDNGASLCQTHHIQAEETTIGCDLIREKSNIQTVILPEHLDPTHKYDKWGNIILPSGQRLKGELFYDESVQKIMTQGGFLDIFQKYVKYPRTYHLPWSNLEDDDKMLRDDSQFIGKRVVCSLKMDGENSNLYNDFYHARSINSSSHESRNWIKGLWSKISYLMDDNMRICGENLYAVHSVKYDNLPSYFMMFSIWIDNLCLSWDETVEYSKILGLDLVPVIYDGIYDQQKIRSIFSEYEKENEGYVIRLADEFTYGNFRKSIAKFVRPEFRQALSEQNEHWISKKIEKNGII